MKLLSRFKNVRFPKLYAIFRILLSKEWFIMTVKNSKFLLDGKIQKESWAGSSMITGDFCDQLTLLLNAPHVQVCYALDKLQTSLPQFWIFMGCNPDVKHIGDFTESQKENIVTFFTKTLNYELPLNDTNPILKSTLLMEVLMEGHERNNQYEHCTYFRDKIEELKKANKGIPK